MEKNYYKILGIPQRSGLKVIKRAYRLKAREYHPDINKSPDAAEIFKEIHEAYEVLTDIKKREEYDKKTQQETADTYMENDPLPDYPWYKEEYWKKSNTYNYSRTKLREDYIYYFDLKRIKNIYLRNLVKNFFFIWKNIIIEYWFVLLYLICYGFLFISYNK